MVTNTYGVTGTFTVTLSVSGLGGSDTISKANYITVYDNNSSGAFTSCLWDFGDGGTSTDCIAPSHDYTAAGVYTVSLTVSGPGGTDEFTEANYITVIGPAVANFQGSPRIGTPPLTVNFSNLSTGSFNTCLWEFGDGGTSNSCGNLSHTYVAIGDYTVSLTVSGDGGTDKETQTNYIMVKEELLIYLPLVFR